MGDILGGGGGGGGGGTGALIGGLAGGAFGGPIGAGLGSAVGGALLGGKDSGAGGEAAAAQAAAKQQAIATLQQQLGPFAEAGLGALPQLVQGSTAEGLGQNLGNIFQGGLGGALQPLVDERTRAVQGQLSAGGLNRSGAALQAAAAVPTDIGFQIEALLNQRQQGLATQGLGSGFAQGVAKLQTGIGTDIGSGIVTNQQERAANQAQTINTGLQVASFFSDPRLKENVEEIGQVDGLIIYQWDWIKKTVGTLIEKFPTIGFMADEVETTFPEFVDEYLGFKVINYHGLLNRLGAS